MFCHRPLNTFQLFHHYEGYEKENQEQLVLTWEAMDRLEDDLKQKLIEKMSKEKSDDRE